MNTLRLSFRQIRSRPGFALLAALSLALGIGLVATQFSLIDGILLRGLPVPDSGRLMHIAYRPPNSAASEQWRPIPYRDFLVMRERQKSFHALAAVTGLGVNLSGEGRTPSRQAGALATANLAEVLGVAPARGRWFTAEEDAPGAPTVVVLSHALWVEEFAADPNVLGRPLTLNGLPATIIGVMPPKFTFPANHRLWYTMRPTPSDPRVRRLEQAEVFGKLRPGSDADAAAAELSAIAASLQKVWPETNAGIDRVAVQPLPFAYAGNGTRPLLLVMLAMTGFILGLGCVNVANMLLGRAAARTREMGVRAAVGASRGQLMAQLLVESLVLAVLGAAGGLLLAAVGVDLLQEHIVNRMSVPGWFEFRLDLRVLAIAVGATVLAGLLAGVVPAWQVSKVDVNVALKDDARAAASLGVSRVGRWLVTLQIALSSALLVAASVLGWTLHETRSANLRFQPEQLITGRIELQEGTHATAEQRARFYRELLDRLGREPGVETLAVTSRILIFPGVSTAVAPEGEVYAHDNDRPNVWLEVVSAEYFRLVGVSPVGGRGFDAREEAAGDRTAVVNASFARRFWPGADAVGRRFRTSQTDNDWVTVIGVVPDLKMQGLFAPPGRDEAGFYLSQDRMGWGWLDLLVRVRGDPEALVPAIRRAIAELDPNQPIHSIGTLQARTVQAMRGFTIIGSMSALFAVVTLFLGAVGVYGVASLAVARRVREFGIRMALGANAPQVLRLVVRQGSLQIAIGLAAGLLTGFVITRPMENLFGEAMANNPLIYLVVAGFTAAIGLIALLLPARRATRIDPIQALRAE
jgi:putative ABC transport system permease protein